MVALRDYYQPKSTYKQDPDTVYVCSRCTAWFYRWIL